MPEKKAMLQSCYDPDRDGIVDRSSAIVSMHESGEGGVQHHQVVFLLADGTVKPADGNNSTHAGFVIGMAVDDIAEGEDGLIQSAGEIVNDEWDLDPGIPYFVGHAGSITAEQPETGFSQLFGVGKDSVTLIINMGTPIIK